ncbi:Uncharacterised protein [Mycobacteroides abscessus]|nr:Uncharacterised protein [Mycobacteroides abscessus]
MPSRRDRLRSTCVSSCATDCVPPAPRASRVARTWSCGGNAVDANHSQMRRSSSPGRSTTTAESTPRPARPTCW